MTLILQACPRFNKQKTLFMQKMIFLKSGTGSINYYQSWIFRLSLSWLEKLSGYLETIFIQMKMNFMIT